MSTGDAILFLVTFALFTVLMLAAVVFVMETTKRPDDDEEDDVDPRD